LELFSGHGWLARLRPLLTEEEFFVVATSDLQVNEITHVFEVLYLVLYIFLVFLKLLLMPIVLVLLRRMGWLRDLFLFLARSLKNLLDVTLYVALLDRLNCVSGVVIGS
jgi:hypothetical protein